ncbi:leucine-rich repeat extensin-like protein 5 [Canna indica]|uniref:Leucine-rich repeat extensin-like protein 5 n=1 Tax=Canna indica TaxID=4628 RepID=A0AAQ3K4Z9_9LILI|nr:leucine-rich repeat extensin-like protein 5 [Canna indica]
MDSPRRHPPAPPPASSSSPRQLDLEVTVVSAKHLKNVNWRNGDLKPYVVAYLDPDRRTATKPDDAGSTRPVWNERLSLALPLPSSEAVLFLTLDVFHSKPSETPKPLVGTARFPLKELLDPEVFTAYASGGICSGGLVSPIRTLELRRPSGRPQGKIRIKLAIREHPCPPPEHNPTHHFPPPPPSSSYYYSSNAPPFPSPSPPPPPPHSARDYRTFSPPPPSLPPYGHPPPQPHPHPSQYPYGSYSDPYSAGYYSPSSAAYYSAPPAPAPAPAPVPLYYERASSYGGPSAPASYSSGFSSYDHKPKGARVGAATGLAVGAVAGALGAIALEEGLKYEEEKIADRVENDFSARDDYSDYRADY